mgnify:FL=1
MLDFGALPPEVNSARIYAGPGSGSLMTAASAWNALAAELNATALSYEKLITALNSEEWLGPASASMAAAVQPYVTWMTTTAAQAEQAATQAQAAAAAYETALASSVPPPLIAANRAETSQLMATNVLGQNTPAITQLEAQYGQMWAQDASAMYSYAGQSASATKVTQFSAAPKISNDTAPATQGAAVTSATTSSTAGNTSTTVSKALTNLSQPGTAALKPLASGPPPSQYSAIWYLLTGQTAFPTSLGALANGYSPFAGFFYNTEGLPYFSVGMGNFGVQMAKTLGWIGGAAPAAAKALPGLGGLGGLLGGGAGAVHPAAAIGGAASIGGKLSVPVAWTGGPAIPAMTHSAIPVSAISAAPEGAGGPGNLLGGMPLAGMGTGTHAGAGPRYGFRPTVMARPPFAG